MSMNEVFEQSQRRATPPGDTARQEVDLNLSDRNDVANGVSRLNCISAPECVVSGAEISSSLSALASFLSDGLTPNVGAFFEASVIAEAINASAKTVHRRAKAEQWPRKLEGNRFLYQPPVNVLCRIVVKTEDREISQSPMVTYNMIAHDPEQVTKVLRRKEAVEHCLENRHLGKETALAVTVVHIKDLYPNFSISVDSLRTWVKRYEQHGLDGLVEQKRGVVGRRSVEVPAEFVALGKALKVEKGSVAAAARELAMHPELPYDMRNFLHGGHASKSYVTPSIRKAITPAAETERRLQGPRHARINGRFTPGNYDNVLPGEWFTSDDMTDNVVVWCEWPNADGYRIGQLQILPVMDIGSLRWLNVRGVMRESGQYNSDDIWGLFGDTFEKFGLPRCGFLLEGGHWQSNRVQGHRTGIEDDVRVGGLQALGLKCVRAYDPRGKGMLEGAFHTLQNNSDRSIGFVGRDQRKELPEHVKRQIAAVKAKRAHPREFFLHMSKRMDEIAKVFESLNHERQDGKILRGMSPLEKWAQANPRLDGIPDSAKWLYRSSYSKVKVTSNGLRVTRGTGKNQLVYYYDNPELLAPYEGTTVIVHWDDYDPSTDAVVRARQGNDYKFIGLAKYVPGLDRFNATDAQLAAERDRKKAAANYARTEIRTMQEHLVRRAKPVAVDGAAIAIGKQIEAARERNQEEKKQKAKIRNYVRNVEVSPEVEEALSDLSDLSNPAPQIVKPESTEMSEAEAREILGGDIFTSSPSLIDEGAGKPKTYVLKSAPLSAPAATSGQFWALWKKVEEIKPGLSRHALTAKALGCHPKVTDMTQEQLAKMISVFSAIIRDSKQ